MKCKQCIHYDVCEIDYFDGFPDGCQHFKSKEDWNLFLEKLNNLFGVKHGYWDDFDRCSVCKKMELGRTNFCPNCGAKMDGEQK